MMNDYKNWASGIFTKFKRGVGIDEASPPGYNSKVTSVSWLVSLFSHFVGVFRTPKNARINKAFYRNFSYKTAFLLLFFVFSANLFGQVASYTFSQSNGTYTAITGGTAHNTSKTDDANYNFTLPFTFNYNGTGYTVVRPSTNGFLVLGGNAP